MKIYVIYSQCSFCDFFLESYFSFLFDTFETFDNKFAV